MRKLATIQVIENIEPIDGADTIVKATVMGWSVVVKKDEFKIGDKCVYIEIDSIVPSSNPIFAFLEDRKYRVKTIKLRKQISQGLCIPVNLFPDIAKKSVGTDVTDILGIIKYDPEAQKEKADSISSKNVFVKFLMRYKWFRILNAYFNNSTKGFPSDVINKSDEERIQNMPALLRNNAGVLVSATEKLDGQSYTATLRKRKFRLPLFSKNEFVVASRNLRIGLNKKGTTYINVTENYKIKDILEKNIGNYDSIAIQGEICGPSIQKNKYGFKGNNLFIFKVKFNDKNGSKILSQESITKFAKENGLETVPYLGEFTLPSSVDELVKLSSSEKSKITPNVLREGIVIREAKDDYSFSFKVINPEFLLKNDD